MLWWLRVVPLLLLLTAGPDGSGSGDTGGSSDTQNNGSSNNNPPQPPVADDDDDDEAEEEDDELESGDTRVAGTEFEKGFKDMLTKHGQGSTRRLAEVLYRTNYQLRESNRLLRAENAQLIANKPRKGSMTLSKQESDAYRAYRALGTPDEVKQRLAAGTEASRELTTRRRNDTLREVADIVGYDFRALKDSAVGSHTFSIKTVEENGTQVRRAFVVTRDGDSTKELPVGDYVQANYPHLLPALQAQSSSSVQRQTGFVRQAPPVQRQQQQQQRPAQTVLSSYGDPPKPS